MSVIVKGMEMPVMCSYCKFREPFIDSAYCHLAEMDMEYEESDNCRHPNCPLVEIPTPHGRLIDVDKFKADYSMKNDCTECEKELRGSSRSCEYDRIYSKMDLCGWLDDAGVVIEAEGSET